MTWVAKLKKPPGDAEHEKAVTELREVVLRGLRGAFFKRGQDEAFCEDVCQESIIKILKNLDSFLSLIHILTLPTILLV